MLFDNVVIRLLGSDDFTTDATQQAAADITNTARDVALSIPVGDPIPLDEIVRAHDEVDEGARDRVIITVLE
jgi:NADPH:quinone reductase